MRLLDAFKVDAFTDRAYAGNPAGVVLVADGLSAAQMQAIAREMNLSETAFVLSPTGPGADLRLRYFTPTTEVKLCGHATVAALHVLVEKGRVAAPARLRVETNAGVLPLDVRPGPEVFLTAPEAATRRAPWDAPTLARLLGANPGAFADEPSVLVVQDDVFVTVRDLAALGALAPDMETLADACRKEGLQGVVAVSYETREAACATHSRYFVPTVGIPEDPVTGVAHMELARYLLVTGRVRAPTSFTGEQGEWMARPGRVRVEIDADETVRIGGRAVTVLEGKMRAP